MLAYFLKINVMQSSIILLKYAFFVVQYKLHISCSVIDLIVRELVHASMHLLMHLFSNLNKTENKGWILTQIRLFPHHLDSKKYALEGVYKIL